MEIPAGQVTIAGIAAAILSLALEWIPGLNSKWAELSPEKKRGIVALLVLVITLLVVGGNCWFYNNCPTDIVAVVIDAVVVFLTSATISQGVYALGKNTNL